jgi:hypothetical protein
MANSKAAYEIYKSQGKITEGLQFRSQHFMSPGEIFSIESNEVSLLLCPSDGHDFIVPGFPINVINDLFKMEIYKPVEPSDCNISVI